MRPRPRIRKTIKWGGLVVAIAVAACWWLTAQRIICYAGEQSVTVMISAGRVELFDSEAIGGDGWTYGWSIGDYEQRTEWKPQYSPGFGSARLAIPLWMLVLLVALPTALAWRLDFLATRRAKLGACPACSYPRNGLAPSSPCPECGAAAPQA